MHVLLSSRRHAGTGAMFVIGAALLWGTVGLVGAIVHQRSGLSALAISFWRLAFASAAMLPLLLRRRPAFARSDRLRLVGVGAALAAYQACYFTAVMLAGVSLATLITLGLAPVLMALGGRLLLDETPQRSTVVAGAVALVGLFLLIGAPASGTVATALSGAGLACGSAAGYAGMTLLTRRRSASGQIATFTAASLGVGALAALPAALWDGLVLPGDAITVLLLVYLGVGPTALAYVAFFRGLTTVAATTAGVLTLIEPAAATLLAVVLLDERLGAGGAAGALLLMATAVTLTLVQARTARTPVTRHAGARETTPTG